MNIENKKTKQNDYIKQTLFQTTDLLKFALYKA
jgi:hypothetical protein